MSRTRTATPLIPVERAVEYCAARHSGNASGYALKVLLDHGLLPVYKSDSGEWILADDFAQLTAALTSTNSQASRHELYALYDPGDEMGISIGADTWIDLPLPEEKMVPTYYAAIRNLITQFAGSVDDGEGRVKHLSYFPPARVSTTSQKIQQFIERQVLDEIEILSSHSSVFANSASYMGSKKGLASFIVEGMKSVVPDDGVVIDLMCGSGAASCALAKKWDTYASDAQHFCQILALIQGGGFSRNESHDLLAKVLPIAREHMRALELLVNPIMEEEASLLHGESNKTLLDDYKRFQNRIPLYPDGRTSMSWDPVSEISLRKSDPAMFPYCLFTAYFSGGYFGVRQSVEIDSLRFAIDQVSDKNQRDWALGALVATLSRTGITYANHFAQPKPYIRDPDKLSLKTVAEVIEKRATSIMHEFSIRLLNLSEESEKAPRPIQIVDGPWQEALTELEHTLEDRKVVVYLDAPYTRDEYSRYYHVLETAVLYNYPSSLGSGRIPNKKSGERFDSEFFTRSDLQFSDHIVRVIRSVLKKGWKCAWSCSDSGRANIPKIVKDVANAVPSRIHSYSTPYIHKSQGRRPPKSITEYLVLFVPDSPE